MNVEYFFVNLGNYSYRSTQSSSQQLSEENEKETTTSPSEDIQYAEECVSFRIKNKPTNIAE
jgi:hypothetical protein